ncbi:MAG: hypothetical protein Unbinned1966contig1000_38 [Prokaryotic dsDNA virus sp.]|nr:MAG: hypothetical protein Unbinned1966contig1000_38 [Prokaryotic dsDNA virus sp.]|tara:strand:+ start:6516 stop:6710 length:195 start_codon:yes stop_codon:yes gene_type:complete
MASKKLDVTDEYIRSSADQIFDIINSPVGKAFMPQAQILNIIDRLIDGSITDEELAQLKKDKSY